MANYDGTLLYNTKVDTSGVEEGLKETERNANGMKNSFEVALGQMMAQLAQKIAATAQQLVASGIQYNSQVEALTTSFTTLTGSEETAIGLMQKLQEAGTSTPYELLGLADTVNILMQYGMTADEAYEATMSLGDISQGSAEKMQSIALALGQMDSLGQVTMNDIRQMINAGFNPLNAVAQMDAASLEKLNEQLEDGTITQAEYEKQTADLLPTIEAVSSAQDAGTLSVQKIKDAMMAASQEGGQFYGSSAAMAETYEGRVNALKESFDIFLGETFRPLFDFVRDTVLPGLTDLLTDTDKMQTILGLLGIVLGTVTAAVIAYNVAQAIATAGSLSAAIAATGLGAAINFLTSPITLVILAIGAVVAAGYLLIKNWDKVKEAAVNLWKNMKEYVLGIINKVKEKFNEAKDIGVNFVKGLWNGIVNAKDWLTSKIKGWVSSVTSAIKSFFGIHSPSKVMEQQVGQYLPKGIAVGIEANTDSALQAIDAMNRQILQESKMNVVQSTGAIASSGSSSIAEQLTAKGLQQINVSVQAKVDEGVLFAAGQRIQYNKDLQYGFGR